MLGKGFEDRYLSDVEIRELCAEAFREHDLTGQRVIVLIPDGTRTAPIPLMFRTFHDLLAGRVAKLDFMIALGTHPAMSDEAINRLVGATAGERAGAFADVDIFNHRWDAPDELRTIGTIGEDEVERITGGLMRERIGISVNRRIFDYDRVIIIGPTFPHEVVGFSGGNKYFFPGISGAEVLHFFHWLGAVITNPVIIGAKRTPVRRVVDRAAAMIDMPKLCFSLVVCKDGVHGLYIGTPEAAWSAAADLSARVHIAYVDRPFKTVLSMAPEMYGDIWTAGKCMYKLEPVLADGADLIIYAPHIDEVSHTHGRHLDRVGYHVRDYFLKQMDRFGDVPRAVMAHSTHVKGIGRFENGVERPRVNVILATRIPEERCRRVNLGYMNPDEIDPADCEGREDEGILCVRRAGEMLYRLSDGTVPRID
ncbi:MAG: lactate racemase domain-containing protein [Candidatus Brocadiia bacterium]|nr:lactate racemase domain-containing protein [Candidatus Brocadiia bacterium]